MRQDLMDIRAEILDDD